MGWSVCLAVLVGTFVQDIHARLPPKAVLLKTGDNIATVNRHENGANESKDTPGRLEQSDPTMAPAEFQKYMEKHKAAAATSSILWACLLTLVAYFWRSTRADLIAKPQESDDFSDLQDWKFGLFSCFEDINLCLCGCCCPAIRWADTMDRPGLLTFWLAFAIFLGFSVGTDVLVYFSQLGGFLGLCFLCFLVYHRQLLRQKFHMEQGGCGTYLGDFLSYCCCAPCTIVQEARQVEEAVRRQYAWQ